MFGNLVGISFGLAEPQVSGAYYIKLPDFPLAVSHWRSRAPA
jgi:hypothetical protein